MTDPRSEAMLLEYINTTPGMQSLLYDIDLMPEQLTRGSSDWRRMLTIAAAWRAQQMIWEPEQ